VRAAVLREFGRPLALEDAPDPAAGAGEIVVEVRAVGLCGTDLKITGGAFAETPLPLVPGHEVAGVVAEAGPGAGVEVGARVALHVYDACGECAMCAAGRETLCPSSRRIGFDLDGGLARYVRARGRNAFRFDDSLDFAAAAVAMDAVVSVWRALRVRAGLRREETVGIAGAGGLGLNAVQVARAAAARVAVVDPQPDHRRAALQAGAELALAPEEAVGLVDWSGGGVDVGLEASGTRAGFEALARCLAPAGRLVCCGYRPGIEYGLDSSDLALHELTIAGSRNGTRADARAALEAVERGEVRPLIAGRLPLSEVNGALERLRRGDVLGRLVIQP
jgi:alcohol dehydrogenase, propanol-preferring